MVVDTALTELQDLIEQGSSLQSIPATWKTSKEKQISSLYLSRCGPFRAPSGDRFYQNCAYMTLHACEGLLERATRFVETRDEIDEAAHPCLWKPKHPEHDAVLNSLPEMPRSPQQRMQALKDTSGETGIVKVIVLKFGGSSIGTKI